MRKKNVARRAVSFLLIMAIMLATFSIDIFAATKTAATYFSGKITTTANVNLAGIKLNVYKSVLSLKEDDFQKYDNEFLLSVKTDKNGAFKFKRPSGMFIITVDMSTLPRKTGISETMWTVADKTVKKISAKVKKISRINISSENAESGEIKVQLLASDKKRVYCDYTTEVTETKVTTTTDKATGKRTFRTDRTITVKANYMKKTQVLTTETTETVTPVVSLDKPVYASPSTYTTGSGFFAINYDKNEYSVETVKNIYDTFTSAKAFYDKYGWRAPKKESGKRRFNVYLTTSGVASATTKFLEDGGNCIVLQAPQNYSRATHPFITSVIAHELFHAIINGYTRECGVVPSKWFREAFANWAGIQFLGYSTETPKTYINIFQSNPELSITETYDSRVYGSMMFALTISEYYGGMATVKKIFEEFKGISTDDPAPETAAMDKALAKVNKSYNFTRAFIKFAMNNMYPSLFYSLPGSDQWNNAARCAADISSDCEVRSLRCKPLSAKYYDASVNKEGKSLYITVYDTSKKYNGTAFCCVVNKKDGSSKCYSCNMKKFTTFKIKNSAKLKNVGVSFGLVNASPSVTQFMDLNITYA